jgi:hypothetical protein
MSGTGADIGAFELPQDVERNTRVGVPFNLTSSFQQAREVHLQVRGVRMRRIDHFHRDQHHSTED